MKFIKNYIHYISFFILVFIIEVIYFYPSPGVDSIWFLGLGFNICREDLFIGLKSVVYNRGAIHEEWLRHGWVMQYLMAKFNFFCSIRGIYLFNFLTKIITSLVLYKILKSKEKNNFFLAMIILCVFVIQMKLEFRPETFSILLYALIYLFFKTKKYFIVGSLFGVLFFTHFVIFCFVGLFGILFFYKDILNIRKISSLILGFLLFVFLLDFIYPYTVIDYITGLMSNSGSRVGSGVYLIHENFNLWLKDFLEFFVFPSFIPLWGVLFTILLINSTINNNLVIFSLPFVWFFGPHVPMGSYYLQGLTPLLLILQYEKIKNINFYTNYKKIFFIFVTIFFLVSSAQIFSRNVLTIFQHGNEFNKSKKFLVKNLEKIDLLPSFGFLLIDNWKLNEQNDNEILYETYSVNGSRNQCPQNNLNYKDPSLYIFGLKLYNSNSGYGIYICEKNK